MREWLVILLFISWLFMPSKLERNFLMENTTFGVFYGYNSLTKSA